MGQVIPFLCGLVLLGLAISGWRTDRSRAEKPMVWVHLLNLALGIAAIGWALIEMVR